MHIHNNCPLQSSQIYDRLQERSPSRPVHPVSCTYVSMSSGTLQCMIYCISGQSIPIPKAMVAMTTRGEDDDDDVNC